MKKIYTILLLLTITLTVSAQAPANGGERFNPERFTKDQETYITKQARLTTQEAAAFFPLFREMQQKARPLFKKMRELVRTTPQNDAEATRLIAEIDKINQQLHNLEMTYHKKFCKTIPPMKVHACLKAEEIFKHITMEKMAKRGPARNAPMQKQK